MRKTIICGIYCIENTINNKKYIGQSVNIYNRWYGHKNELRKNIHDNDYLQKSWNKYGEENFEFKILEECSSNELNDKERYYIDLFNTINRDFGYNLKTGGQDSNYMSEECKQKISNSLKSYYSDNPIVKEKRKINALNQWANPEIKKKIMGKNNGMYGRTHSEDARRKISESALGRPSCRRNMNAVKCIELDKIYECAADAGRELKIGSYNIVEVCKGIRKTCGGYHWKFVMENNI